ncbi:MAG: Zn-ribbon domain-containing protein [Candidatus Woesearchaeota archaeon]
MLHKCIKCGKLYEQSSEELLIGCTCGSRLFYFIKPESVNKKKDSEEVEYFYELEDNENHELIVFDIESINVKGSGKYELNIDSMMNNKGMIYKYGDGKYGIDIESNLKHVKSRKKG